MVHGATINLRAAMTAAADKEEFNRAAEIKNKITVIEAGAMRKYGGTDVKEERAESLKMMRIAVQREEFDLAASLKIRIQVLDECIGKEEAKAQAKSNINTMADDPEAAANFLDNFLDQQEPNEKKKRKKKKKKARDKTHHKSQDRDIQDKEENDFSPALDMNLVEMEGNAVRARTQSEYNKVARDHPE